MVSSTVTITADTTVEANFNQQHTLTIAPPTGEPVAWFDPLTTAATITADPTPPGGTASAPFNGGPDEVFLFEQGEVVTLTADPGPNALFEDWNGDLASVNNPDTIVMDTDKTVSARFFRKFFITVIDPTSDQGMVEDPPGDGGGVIEVAYQDTPTFTITPQADIGYHVLSILVDGVAIAPFAPTTNASAVETYTFDTPPIDADHTIAATYAVNRYGLQILTTGPGSVEIVDSSPAPIDGEYLHGTVITVAAVPDLNADFSTWQGDVFDPASATTTIIMIQDSTITAEFVIQTVTLSIAKAGGGSGSTVTPDIGIYDYAYGDTVNLQADPDVANLYVFEKWVGNVDDPNAAATTITLLSDQTVTAFFQQTVNPDADVDGDGYTPNQGDCDDDNPDINPGEIDLCGDGVDQDCSGQDAICDPGEIDNDGDGYTVSQGDCDDYDSTIHPNADELCGDGIDQDCDTLDVACAAGDIDNDGDGFSVNLGDCNDSNSAIYPGATEICEDGVDNDCFDGDRLCSNEIKCVDIADLPLDTQFRSAPAMLMFVLDDSGSMDWEFSVQGQTDGKFDDYVEYLFDNPGDNVYLTSSTNGTILSDPQRREWRSQWSSHNKMYFNPTVAYDPWPLWNELPGTQGKPIPVNAHPNTPRSNPRYSGNTFNLDGEFIRIGGGGGGGALESVRVTHQDEWYQSWGRWYERVTGADAVRLYQGGVAYMTVDNEDGNYFSVVNTWSTTTNGPEVNANSRYSTRNGATATWQLPIPLADAGLYEVRVWVPDVGYRRVLTAPYTITHAGGTTNVVMDQANNEETWYSLGTYTFNGANIVADIIVNRSHYYVWNDADNDGVVDTIAGEVYLVVLDGPAASGSFRFYRFFDADNDNVVDDGELTLQTAAEARTAGVYPTDGDGNDLLYADVRQNFANWYSFYRRRELTAKAAVGQVIFDMQGVKIGFKAINGSVNQTVQAVKIPGQTDYTNDLLDDLYSINSGGGTPLRAGLLNVGRYFHSDAETGGLGSSPYAAEADGGGCQQAFAIVMTDGYYNGTDPTFGNADGDNSSPYDTDENGPYGDAIHDTLADIAMHYYESDLSGVANMVPVSDADPAPHQHMVTYTIGFGVQGTLPGDDAGCPVDCDWPDSDPSPQDFSNQEKIDDMYHAAVNGRGQFLSAENPEALVQALNALREDIEKRIGSGASVSINSQELYEGTVLYQGTYDTADWSGDIKAYRLVSPAEAAADPNLEVGDIHSAYEWSSSDQLDTVDWNDRNIITFDGTSGMPFRYAELATAGLAPLLDANATTAERMVQYFRGDNTYDQQHLGTFRYRGSKIGDIVHSAPHHYNNIIWVGANDGMLHAFDDSDGSEIFGYVPRIVTANLNKLTVANPNYVHTYFVDQAVYIRNIGGSPATTLLVAGLGKGGKGYFCLDISDIDATTVAESVAANIVKWEYPNTSDPDNSPDADMGYSFSQAYLVNSQAGWVVIFGNGYDSTNKKAVLYVLDAQTGNVIRKLDTGAGGWGPDGVPDTADDECNGLGTPALIDPSLDGKVDYVYAGDLLGNLWKFDLTDNDYNNWGSAYHDGVVPTPTPQPLFQARNGSGDRQPITTRPDVIRHCDRGQAGYIVLFGTGRYLGAADFADYSVQSLYGIYDWADAFEAAGQTSYDKYLGYVESVGIPSVRGNTLSNLNGNGNFTATGQDVHLLEQTMIWAGTSMGVELRVLSDNATNYYDPDDNYGSHAGWYFDLPYESERMVRDLIVRDGVLITISSIPSASPCASGGDSIIHEINACTGGRLDAAQFDISGPDGVPDGIIDSHDLINIGSPEKPVWVAPSGLIQRQSMLYTPAILPLPPTDDGLKRDIKYFSTSRGTVETVREKGENIGMFYWKEYE